MTIPPEQQETAAFLRALAGCDPVETHISLVFRGADTVWKLKKAVRLPFLDFTPLDERRRFAERELALNAPAAPGLYRDVVCVVRRADHALALCQQASDQPAPDQQADDQQADDQQADDQQAGDHQADWAVVDWVLRMARVPERDFLDVMAAEGRLDTSLLDALADGVAAYHRALPPVPDVLPPMRDIALGNVRSARAAGMANAPVEAWRATMLAALDARAGWLAARARGGLVRRAHGDLHLGNLCLWRGRPVPFDALEFDETLATIDLGYDLAFLLMDLERRVGRAAANRVLNRYVARSGDAGLVKGLPVFLSMRAMVRAHVEAKIAHNETAADYLKQAQTYLHPPQPVVVAIGGLPGTGKSTLARALAPGLGAAPGALVLRSDEIRKRRFAVAPEERLPPAAYSKAVSQEVIANLAEDVSVAASGGHAVVADATFIDRADRTLVAQAAARAGVDFIGLWLDAPLAELEARVAGRARDASDATVEVLRAAARANPGPGDWMAVDTTDAATAWNLVTQAVRSHLVPCWNCSPALRE